MKKIITILIVSAIGLLLLPNVLANSCTNGKPPAPAQNQICQGVWKTVLSINGASPSSVSIQGFGDRLIIAAQGTDNKVYVKEINVTTQSVSVDWYVVNNGLTTASPKLVVKKSKLVMYVQGTDGNTYNTSYQGPGTWSAWVNTYIQNTCFGSSGTFDTRGSDGQLYQATGNPLELQFCARTSETSGVHAPYNGLVTFNTNDGNVITFSPPVVGIGGAGANLISNSTNYFIIKNMDNVTHSIVFAGQFYYPQVGSGPALCPYSNILDITRVEFSVDGGPWTQMKYLNMKNGFYKRGYYIGDLSAGDQIDINLRVNVPPICNGTFPLNDNSKYFLLFL